MLDVGVILPSIDTQRREGLDLPAAAQHAEDVGLDSVWHGDHLAVGRGVLDSTVALAAAATATRRIIVGTSVFVPALRQLAWAAKQIASLVWISNDRLVLGVGSGGGPEQWAAAGVPYAERGARTDAALELLPDLLAGKEVPLPTDAGAGAASVPVRLEPATAVPPIWVGNASAVALRRAARLGDGWFPSLVGPEAVASGAQALRELRDDELTPLTIAIGAAGALGSRDAGPSREELARGISEAYGRPLDQVLDIPLVGSGAGTTAASEIADRLARYAEAGAHHVVVGLAGDGWRAQCTTLAEIRTLLCT